MNTSQKLNVILGISVIVLTGVVVYLSLQGYTQNPEIAERQPVERPVSEQPVGSENTVPDVQPLPEPGSAAGSNPVLPAGWKKYSNDRYKFSIGYPADWYVIDSSSGALSVSTTQACRSGSANSLEQFNDQFRSCERFTAWAGDTTPASFTDIHDDNYFKVTIGGVEGQKFIYNLASQGSVDGQLVYIPRATIEAQVQKNGVWYKFSMVLHQQNINRAIQEFDRFLATVQFDSQP